MVSVLFTAFAMIATGQVGVDRADRYGPVTTERVIVMRAEAPARRRRGSPAE